MPSAAKGTLSASFSRDLERAKAEGFEWIVPKNHMTLKTGLIPGEVSVNVTRFHGNGLDDHTEEGCADPIAGEGAGGGDGGSGGGSGGGGSASPGDNEEPAGELPPPGESK